MAFDREKARAFAGLHRPGDPVILFNIWDAGSARTVAEAGARALATGSHPVASAQGFPDGERIPIELALDNLRRIVGAVDLPVTLDFEGGYAEEPGAVAANVGRVAEAGAVGVNFEDRVVGTAELRDTAVQSRRIAAIRQELGADFFINARTDVFLVSPPEEHAGRVEAALERGLAYAEAGASGLFFPGVRDETLMERLCEASPLPVNLIASPLSPPIPRLAALGAARISHAAGPWRIAMAALGEAARKAHHWREE